MGLGDFGGTLVGLGDFGGTWWDFGGTWRLLGGLGDFWWDLVTLVGRSNLNKFGSATETLSNASGNSIRLGRKT